MTQKPIEQVDPQEKIFCLKDNDNILYLIDEIKGLEVYSVIIGGPIDSLGQKKVFDQNQIITIPDPCILGRARIKEKFVAEHPKSPGEFIFLELIGQEKEDKWECRQIYPKSSKTWNLSLTTPIFKVNPKLPTIITINGSSTLNLAIKSNGKKAVCTIVGGMAESIGKSITIPLGKAVSEARYELKNFSEIAVDDYFVLIRNSKKPEKFTINLVLDDSNSKKLRIRQTYPKIQDFNLGKNTDAKIYLIKIG